MFTSKSEGHNHRVNVDGQGTGKTIDTSSGIPHTHTIEDWVVADKNGHIHELESTNENDLGTDKGEASTSSVKDAGPTTAENIEKHKLKVEVVVTQDSSEND